MSLTQLRILVSDKRLKNSSAASTNVQTTFSTDQLPAYHLTQELLTGDALKTRMLLHVNITFPDARKARQFNPNITNTYSTNLIYSSAQLNSSLSSVTVPTVVTRYRAVLKLCHKRLATLVSPNKNFLDRWGEFKSSGKSCHNYCTGRARPQTYCFVM